MGGACAGTVYSFSWGTSYELVAHTVMLSFQLFKTDCWYFDSLNCVAPLGVTKLWGEPQREPVALSAQVWGNFGGREWFHALPSVCTLLGVSVLAKMDAKYSCVIFAKLLFHLSICLLGCISWLLKGAVLICAALKPRWLIKWLVCWSFVSPSRHKNVIVHMGEGDGICELFMEQ